MAHKIVGELALTSGGSAADNADINGRNRQAERQMPSNEKTARMRKSIRWILSGSIVLIILLASGGLYHHEKLVRLWNVNSMFDKDRIVSNFSSMKDMFLSVPIATGQPPYVWGRQAATLPVTYRYEGNELDLADWIERTSTTSLLVVRDGKIASENYYLGTGPDDSRISWSVAKSFLSAAVGIAVERGEIKSLNDEVTDYVPDLIGTAYDGATVRNVLHMASGVAFDENYLDYNSDINRMGRTLALGGSMDGFAASLRQKRGKPGEVRRYTSIDTHVLSMVLRKATGKSLADMVGQDIVAKLGFESEPYYLADGYGVAFALGGLNMTTRDYARFGQLYLDHGKWQGQQVIPESWARESVRNTAPPSDNPQPFGYGYQWWVPKDAEDEFFAVGIYGQYIYVNRPSSTVIVKTSAHRGFRDDGIGGNAIKHETIEAFRSIARGLGQDA